MPSRGRAPTKKVQFRKWARILDALKLAKEKPTATVAELARHAGVSDKTFKDMRTAFLSNPSGVASGYTKEEVLADRAKLVEDHSLTVQDMEEKMVRNKKCERRLDELLNHEDPNIQLQAAQTQARLSESSSRCGDTRTKALAEIGKLRGDYAPEISRQEQLRHNLTEINARVVTVITDPEDIKPRWPTPYGRRERITNGSSEHEEQNPHGTAPT